MYFAVYWRGVCEREKEKNVYLAQSLPVRARLSGDGDGR